jgi:flagellar motor switch protein FliN/FliY
MNNDAANALAEGFLKGAFSVLDAMLSVSFSYDVRKVCEVRPVTAGDLADYLARSPVAMRAKVTSGGPLALLFRIEDASRFASMVLGEAPIAKTALDANDINTLREVADPCLGGGVTNLMEKYGHGVEPPEGVEVGVVTPEDVQDLGAFLGETITAVSFGFSSKPDIDSEGVLLLSERMLAVMSSHAVAASPPKPAAPPPALSEDELGDILGAFGTATPQKESQKLAAPARLAPPNIDMVLDIRLVATARLGHIEMPLGDILALGPGSIIPVGRLVDEPVELLVNDKLIARGDVVVVDERFGLRITEIVSAKDRIEILH